MSEKRQTESVLLALFDAQSRIAHERQRILDECDNSDERGVALNSFEVAEQKIAETAVDHVQRAMSTSSSQARILEREYQE